MGLTPRKAGLGLLQEVKKGPLEQQSIGEGRRQQLRTGTSCRRPSPALEGSRRKSGASSRRSTLPSIQKRWRAEQGRFRGCLTEATVVVCRMRPGLACVLLSSCRWSRTVPVPPACPLMYHNCTRAASSQPEKQRTYWQYLRRKVLKPPTPPYSHVCQVGDPVLRCAAAPVEPSQVASREVQVLIQTLVRVMRREECVGLSAPQVGVPLQVFVAEFPEKMWQENAPSIREAKQMEPFPLRVFVNPAMRVINSQLVSFPEGCSSISGFSACVPRYQAVHISGLNEAGEVTSWQASGWAARIIQHEMDHLQGVLYLDKMESRTFLNIRWAELNE